MAIDLELAPKVKRAAGEPCCAPVVYPDVAREHAVRMAGVAKALGDPIRLQLVDVLRKHAGKVCVCELVPLSWSRIGSPSAFATSAMRTACSRATSGYTTGSQQG